MFMASPQSESVTWNRMRTYVNIISREPSREVGFSITPPALSLSSHLK